MLIPKLPFAFHAVIESFAALSFILQPDKQLPGCSPAAKLILRQYGGLLLVTNFICVIVLVQPTFRETERLLAAALGSYHAWPSYRAWVRLRNEVEGDLVGGSTLGGPAVHLIVHLLCFGMFMVVVGS
ncbi:uncharacterized protein BCR38DRAFT_202225 [Pseudomassariella vexata]|uniref:Uncharacterized protein n=1 Tax=Pseudomassariella vexata TaxID=1141098 RepID=A0A1Y2DX82_9PEZI|nr:uncharacterized protein BCR38DRAFT_202225 [Pseudomassariella vexata]ORY63902.1 hypothetical protein BCR38DRAFT_202225 [Pseudomassariella vexata]